MLLSKQQKSAVKKLRRNKGGAVWFKVGEGKTRIAYRWFATIAKRCESNPVFVVVCRRKAFYDWQQEAVKLGLRWRVCDFEIFSGKLTGRPLVLLVSHGMLHKLRDSIRDYASCIQAVAYDEGFLYKTAQSQHTKAANKLSRDVGRACILSGSIMTARNLEDVYGQFYAINMHEQANLGHCLTTFRSKFMFDLHIDPNKPWLVKRINQAGAAKQVGRLVRPFASIYLPDSRRVIRNIPVSVGATRDQLDAFDMLKREWWYRLKDGTFIELKNKPSLLIKCQQVSDGFIQMGKTGPCIQFESEKLQYLAEKICELAASGERCIVWCAFNKTVDIILQWLQKHLPTIAKNVYGFTGTRRFDHAGWQRNGLVCVATEDCGSSVNHFAQVKYAIYYSMSFKWLSLQQSQGRTDRKDSRHPVCYYYYLYTKEGLDKYVHDTVLKSAKAEKDLIDYTQVDLWLANPEHSPSARGKLTREITKKSRTGAGSMALL